MRIKLERKPSYASGRNPDESPTIRARYRIKCGATMLMNSRELITLVVFQNFGKCRWLPVIR